MLIQIFLDEPQHFFRDGIGFFKFNDENLNIVFSICIITYVAISLSSFLRERFFVYKKKTIYNHYSESLKKIYYENRVLILFVFIFFLILIAYINISNSIFLRGSYNKEVNHLIYSFFALLILYIIPAITCYLIDLNNSLKQNDTISMVYAYIEPLISNFGINSRNTIFGSLAYFLGIIYSKCFNINNYKKIVIFLFILILFGINFFLVSNFFSNRDKITSIINKNVYTHVLSLNNKKQQAINKSKTFSDKREALINDIKNTLKPYIYSDISNSLLSRLIGIEGIMAVVGKKEDLNFSLLHKALIHKERPGQISFYDKFKGWNKRGGNFCNDNKCITNFSLMGLVAFLMYSGSFTFLFFSIFLIFNLFSLTEFIVYKLTKNKILCAYIGQLIIYRCIHFGYKPLASYKIVFAIILAIVAIFLVNKLLNYLANRINATSKKNFS